MSLRQSFIPVLSGTRIVGRLGAESAPSMAHATPYW